MTTSRPRTSAVNDSGLSGETMQKMPRFIPLLPWLILAIMLSMTFFIWLNARSNARLELKTYFDFRVRQAEGEIEQRMHTYEQVLRGTAGFFKSFPSEVTRSSFREYVASLKLEEQYPGIQGVGFSKIVEPSRLEEHIAQIRGNGFPGYTIRPAGPREKYYTSIIYLEPFAGRNLRAFGYDMYSEPVRREAMQRACESGRTSMSGKVELVQESGTKVQAGFLMYIPVFKKNSPQETSEDRNRNIEGWAYMPFRMGDLMFGLFGEQANDLEIEIYDTKIERKNIMFDSDTANVTATDANLIAAAPVTIGGHQWIVLVKGLPGITDRVDMSHPGYIGLIGLIASMLVTIFTWFLINGQKRAIRLAEEHENRYKDMVQHATDPITIIDTDRKILDANERALQHYGYSLDEMKTMYLDELRPEQIRQETAALFEEIIVKGASRFETQHMNKSGKVIPVEVSNRLIYLQGKPVVMSFTRDISGRKEAERQLMESRQQLTFALEGSSVGIWDWKVETGDLIFDIKKYQFTGIAQEEFDPVNIQSLSKIIHPDDFRAARKQLAKHFKWEIPAFEQEVRFRRRDGKWHWLLVKGKVTEKNREGKPVRMTGTHLDINRRKKNEEALKWNESLLRLMASSSPLGFLVVDNRTDNILYFNHQFCKIWGITHLEMRMAAGEMKNNDIIPHCLPVLADVPAFAESCKPLQSEDNRITIEDLIPFVDGRTVRRFSTQIRGDKDEYYGRFYIFEEITEQINAQKQLADYAAELKKLNAAKDRMFSIIAHDLRGPFGGIVSMIDHISESYKTLEMEEIAIYITGMHKTAYRVFDLLTNLLDWARLQTGALTPAPVYLYIQPLVDEIEQLFASNASAKLIKFENIIDADLIIYADQKVTATVLRNLISNAVKFSNVGGVIRIKAEKKECFAEISVRDKGVGINEQAIEKIFSDETVFSTKGTMGEGGTGLGLTLCRELVEKSGGRIWVNSIVGEGTTFYITLPLDA